MAHRDHHPTEVPGCFGCKVLGIGVDGKHLTKTVRVTADDGPQTVGTQTEHRDGRMDAHVLAPTTTFRMHATEQR